MKHRDQEHLRCNSVLFRFRALPAFGAFLAGMFIFLEAISANPAPNAWTQHIRSDLPPQRDYANLAFDPVSQKAVLFGGNGLDGQLNDTWTWDGSTWTRVQPANSPPPREGAVMVYDGARGNVVLFGGYDGNNLLGDTWIWDGANWTQRFPANSPPPRRRASAAYVGGQDVAVIFGGNVNSPANLTAGSYANDTWAWDGTNWTNLLSPLAPTPRFSASMAYDPNSGTIVLFGGEDYLTPNLNDTWLWNGTTWLLQNPSAMPSPREGAAMIYDPTAGNMVLFGGFAVNSVSVQGRWPTGTLGDTWTWDGTNWTQQTLSTAPRARGFAAATYGGAAGGGALVFGGSDGGLQFHDTWAWGNSQWTAKKLDPDPDPRRWYWMEEHAATGKVVLFSGFFLGTTGRVPDTWTWDGYTWTRLSLASAPSGRSGAGMAAFPPNNTDVLFGGFQDGASNNWLGDTWTWDGTAWTQQHPMNSPPPLDSCQMTYDVDRGNVVLFGGGTNIGALVNDTWIWDGTNWTHLTPAHLPPARANGAMTFDPSTRKVTLFGGYASGHSLGDMWTWDGSDWIQVNPPVLPPARDSAGVTTDYDSGTIVLFGGSSDQPPYYFNDTWVWDGSAWTQQTTDPTPQRRALTRLAYDSIHHNVLMFSGVMYNGQRNDTWTWARTPVQLTNVVSRKAHGSAGTFDVDLPLTGNPGIECRNGGTNGDYSIVFTFLNPLTSVGGANVTSGTGSVSSSNIDSSDAHNYIVNLTGVANAQVINVSLENMTDSVGNFSNAVSAQMGVLLGDVNASRRVDAADVSLVRQQTLQPIGSSNFRSDLNASGRIDAADVSIARQQTLTSLP